MYSMAMLARIRPRSLTTALVPRSPSKRKIFKELERIK